MPTGLMLYPPSPTPDVVGLGSDDERVEATVEWFHANFEDPSNSMPIDEGEFVYIWGGPYEAHDQLSDAFGGDIAEVLVHRAVEEVESGGIVNWAPHENRVRPEEPDDEAPDEPIVDTPPPPASYVQMQAHLVEIEEILKGLEPPEGPFGHNKPPPEAQYVAITVAERDKILEAVADLKQTPAFPAAEQIPVAERHLKALQAFGQKIATWIKNNVLDSAGKAFGAALGVAIAAQLTGLQTSLLAAAEAGLKWLADLVSVVF